MWDLSTGMQGALLAQRTTNDAYVLGSSASVPLIFTTAGISAASGLGVLAAGDWVFAVTPLNNNVIAKVLTASPTQLTFPAGSWTAETPAIAAIMTLRGASFLELMENSSLHLYSSPQPASADAAETGTLLAKISSNDLSFVSGLSANGLNLGSLTSNVLKRGIDPATGIKEIWSGSGIAEATTFWGRWYINNVVTGASTTAKRCDGTVTSTPGGDIVMESGLAIAVDVPAVVKEVSIVVAGV